MPRETSRRSCRASHARASRNRRGRASAAAKRLRAHNRRRRFGPGRARYWLPRFRSPSRTPRGMRSTRCVRVANRSATRPTCARRGGRGRRGAGRQAWPPRTPRPERRPADHAPARPSRSRSLRAQELGDEAVDGAAQESASHGPPAHRAERSAVVDGVRRRAHRRRAGPRRARAPARSDRRRKVCRGHQRLARPARPLVGRAGRAGRIDGAPRRRAVARRARGFARLGRMYGGSRDRPRAPRLDGGAPPALRSRRERGAR